MLRISARCTLTALCKRQGKTYRENRQKLPKRRMAFLPIGKTCQIHKPLVLRGLHLGTGDAAQKHGLSR
jgi:hypothetical protein